MTDPEIDGDTNPPVQRLNPGNPTPRVSVDTIDSINVDMVAVSTGGISGDSRGTPTSCQEAGEGTVTIQASMQSATRMKTEKYPDVPVDVWLVNNPQHRMERRPPFTHGKKAPVWCNVCQKAYETFGIMHASWYLEKHKKRPVHAEIDLVLAQYAVTSSNT